MDDSVLVEVGHTLEDLSGVEADGGFLELHLAEDAAERAGGNVLQRYVNGVEVGTHFCEVVFDDVLVLQSLEQLYLLLEGLNGFDDLS